MSDRKCIHCLSLKPLAQFHVKRDGTIGVRCKSCQVNLNRAAAKFRKQNREKIKLAARDYRASHPERTKATNTRYNTRHPDMYLLARTNYNHRRRAASTATVKPIRVWEWRALKKRQKYRCYYCGAKKPLTQDHVIPLSRDGAHEILNVVAVCLNCNGRKSNKPPEEFAKEIGRLLI